MGPVASREKEMACGGAGEGLAHGGLLQFVPNLTEPSDYLNYE